MVGSLDSLETAAYMEITNEHHAGYAVSLPNRETRSHSVMVKGYDRKATIRTHENANGLSFDIYNRIEANIQEKTGSSPVTQHIPELETEFESILKENQLMLIQKTQKLGTDIFGFGEYVRGEYPSYWISHVQTRDQWDEIYRHVPVQPHVKIFIRRFGMAAE